VGNRGGTGKRAGAGKGGSSVNCAVISAGKGRHSSGTTVRTTIQQHGPGSKGRRAFPGKLAPGEIINDDLANVKLEDGGVIVGFSSSSIAKSNPLVVRQELRDRVTHGLPGRERVRDTQLIRFGVPGTAQDGGIVVGFSSSIAKRKPLVVRQQPTCPTIEPPGTEVTRHRCLAGTKDCLHGQKVKRKLQQQQQQQQQ
jgi:hypothetical protein